MLFIVILLSSSEAKQLCRTSPDSFSSRDIHSIPVECLQNRYFETMERFMVGNVEAEIARLWDHAQASETPSLQSLPHNPQLNPRLRGRVTVRRRIDVNVTWLLRSKLSLVGGVSRMLPNCGPMLPPTIWQERCAPLQIREFHSKTQYGMSIELCSIDLLDHTQEPVFQQRYQLLTLLPL